MISDSNPPANKMRYYINFFMVAVYLALGLLFLFTGIGATTFSENRKPVGIVFMVYGLFRGIVTVQKIRKHNSEA